jgi:hypothetical protein
MKPFNSQEYPNREYWRNPMEEKHIKESNAGQSTPGRDQQHYLAYLMMVDNSFTLPFLTFEQWQAQHNMIECQKLREG